MKLHHGARRSACWLASIRGWAAVLVVVLHGCAGNQTQSGDPADAMEPMGPGGPEDADASDGPAEPGGEDPMESTPTKNDPPVGTSSLPQGVASDEWKPVELSAEARALMDLDSRELCMRLTDRLVECGLLMDTTGACRVTAPVSGDLEYCRMACLLDASCEALRYQTCESNEELRAAPGELGECGTACTPDYFRCDNGLSIEGELVCDGFDDCSNGHDERDCDRLGSGMLFTCDDGTLLSRNDQCDGTDDCGDGSDERECGDALLTCGDGTQHPAWLSRCDGYEDCEDGSDEQDCVERPRPTCN